MSKRKVLIKKKNMKKLLLFFILGLVSITFLSCTKGKKSITIKESEYSVRKGTEKFSINGKDIYMPVFQEYTDYYSNEDIQNICDNTVGAVGNKVEAIYYNNRDTAMINRSLNSGDAFFVDDYFIVCYTEGFNKIENKISDFSTIIKGTKSYISIDENWEILLSKAETYGVVWESTIAIDEYRIAENAHTFVFLASQENQLTISYYNLILINGRVVNVYYYFTYADKNSVEISKANNLNIVKSILKEN